MSMCVYVYSILFPSLKKLEVMQIHSILIKWVYHQKHFFPPAAYTNIFWSEQLCNYVVKLLH